MLDHLDTIPFSFEWCRVCRMPVYELYYFVTQILNIKNVLYFNSQFILANIVIVNSRAFLSWALAREIGQPLLPTLKKVILPYLTLPCLALPCLSLPYLTVFDNISKHLEVRKKYSVRYS